MNSLFFTHQHRRSTKTLRVHYGLEGMKYIIQIFEENDECSLRMMFEEITKRRLVDEDEENDDFEGISITYKQKDSGEENEW